jgi:tyrosine-protein phosphatase SIW14
MADSTNYPIFVHCQHGQDRTGVIVALYRIFYEQWTPQAAHDEMMNMGFHPELVPLNHYFEIKSGFED